MERQTMTDTHPTAATMLEAQLFLQTELDTAALPQWRIRQEAISRMRDLDRVLAQ